MLSLSRRAVLALPIALAACGFQPVYGPGGAGGTLQGQVEVSEPDTRDAFLVTQRLEERLGRAGNPTFELDLTVRSEKDGLAVDREGSTTRFNLLGEAEYALTDSRTGQIITSGSVDSFTGYSATGTTVSTLAAERDAQQRLMVILADQIVTRLLTTDLP